MHDKCTLLLLLLMLLTGKHVGEDERGQTAENAEHGEGQTELHLCRERNVF